MVHSPYSHQEQPWYIASGFLLSISIHVVLLLQLSHINLPDAEAPHQVTFVEVELVHMAIAQEISQDTSTEALDPKNNIQKEAVLEPEKTKLIKQEVVKPKVVKKLVKKKIEPHVAKETNFSPKLIANSSASTHIAVKVQRPSGNQAQLKQMRQQYLSRIMSIIKSHKRYPYSARRRHIEGDVRVSFVMDGHGNISALDISGGSSALRLSTRLAIEESLPFPVALELLSQPIHPQFVMQYRLK